MFLVGDIFFQNRWMEHDFIMERCEMFLFWCAERFRTLPADFDKPLPIFTFFVISKKALFQWYTFRLKISIFESCEFYRNFVPVFYLQLWEIAFRQFWLKPNYCQNRLYYAECNRKYTAEKLLFFRWKRIEHRSRLVEIGREGLESFWDIATKTFDTFP